MTDWLILAAVVAGAVACLISVRQTCLVALTLLREHLAAQSATRADEIAYLRGQVSRKDSEILAVAHPTVHARMNAQEAPQKLRDDHEWNAFMRNESPRNPTQFVTRGESDIRPQEIRDTVPRVSRGGVEPPMSS